MVKSDLVDEPWSYVIALSSLVAQAIVGGYAYTSGIFYELFSEAFEGSDPLLVSWLSSLPLCSWFIGCPIGSAVLNKWGIRVCCIFGGILSSVGLFVCHFSTRFVVVLVFYGIISGLGHGIMYTGFVTAVNRYIRIYRTSVTVISTLGPYLGMSAYSFMVPYLTEQYSMRGTFLLLSGISLHLFVCSCTLFPLPRNNYGGKAKTGINVKLITQNPCFCLFCVQNVFCNLSNSLFLLHLPAYVLSRDYSNYEASLSMTVFGLSNCAGKLIYAIGGYFKETSAVIVYTISLSVYGACTILIAPSNTLHWILVFDALAAFSYCVTGGHNFLTIQELVGEDQFADGVGLCFLSKSIGVFLAGPVAGFLLNTSGSYDVTFYVSGSAMLIGCLLMVPVCVKQFQAWRQTKPGPSIDIASTPLKDSHDDCDKIVT